MQSNKWKIISDADGDNIPIIGEDVLQPSSNLDGLAIDIVLVPFKLTWRMDGLALCSVCILVQNDNLRSMLGLDSLPSCHNRDVGDLMIVKASETDSMTRLLNDVNIITSNTFIGSSINKWAIFLRFVRRDWIMDVMDSNLAVYFAVDHNFIIFGRRWRTCEDIHHCSVQQCHEPMGKSASTKSMQGRSTRPLHKVTFSHSGPTTIRPDLNNFLAWLHRPPRSDRYTMAHAAHFDGLQAFAHRLETEPFSPHILNGLESNLQTSFKTIRPPSSHACQEDPRSSKLPRYPGLFSLPDF